MAKRLTGLSRYWFRVRRFVALKVLHADDPPHAIALGTAIAMFVAFLPLVGFQTVIAVALSALFKANKIVCVPIVWITNPVTMGPIYLGCYKLGGAVMPGGRSSKEDIDGLVRLAREANLFDGKFWSDLGVILGRVSIDLWVGCALVGIALAVPAYFVSRTVVSTYRERRRQKMLRRSLFRAKVAEKRLAAKAGVPEH